MRTPAIGGRGKGQAGMTGQVDALEILTRVEQYYQDAFTNLMVFFTVALAVLGIGIPFLLEFYRNRSFKTEMARRLAEMRKELASQMSAQKESFDRIVKETADQGYRQVCHHSAIHWCEMADALVGTTGEAWPFALRYWCYAINSALEAHWKPTDPWWSLLLKCMGPFRTSANMKVIAFIRENKAALIETIGRLRQMPAVEPYTLLLRELGALLEDGKD